MSDQPQRCRMCPGSHPPIPGDGPQPSRIMFVGEQPAKHEVRQNRPFAGDSGQELDNYLWRFAGLKRTAVYVTNVIKCMTNQPGEEADPHIAQCCMNEWLPREVLYTHPDIIVTLGAVAYRTMFPKQAGEHPLEHQHGIPLVAGYGAHWYGYVIPMYHPAAGIRDAGYMQALQDDFRVLGQILRDEAHMGLDSAVDRHVPWDPCQTPVYDLCTGPDDVIRHMTPAASTSLVAMDTETDEGAPWCLSLSATPGTGLVILREDAESFDTLMLWLIEHPDTLALWHNEPFDNPIAAVMGIHTPKFCDTMVLAYNLQNQPQGLKALAYRLCGMKMTDYDDVVTPHSKRMMEKYIRAAAQALVLLPAITTEGLDIIVLNAVTALSNPFHEQSTTARVTGGGVSKAKARTLYREWLGTDPDALMQYRGKTVAAVPGQEYYLDTFIKVVNGLKSGSESTVRKLDGMIRSLESDFTGTDPWKRWDGWGDEDRGRIIKAVGGPPPQKSIRYVPMQEAVAYAARDADATLRIYPILRKLRANILRNGTGGGL